jgi:hypothetical protein
LVQSADNRSLRSNIDADVTGGCNISNFADFSNLDAKRITSLYDTSFMMPLRSLNLVFLSLPRESRCLQTISKAGLKSMEIPSSIKNSNSPHLMPLVAS